MGGLCAAISAPRDGARTTISQDRPVFVGNASSEVGMWICGADGAHNKKTGLLEEIQLEHQDRNPTGKYSIGDSVLWSNAYFQPVLTLSLNTTWTEAEIMARASSQLTIASWPELPNTIPLSPVCGMLGTSGVAE